MIKEQQLAETKSKSVKNQDISILVQRGDINAAFYRLIKDESINQLSSFSRLITHENQLSISLSTADNDHVQALFEPLSSLNIFKHSFFVNLLLERLLSDSQDLSKVADSVIVQNEQHFSRINNLIQGLSRIKLLAQKI